MNITTIDIQIVGYIPDEIQQQFLDDFSNQLNCQLNETNITDSIKKSLTTLLYDKPTDMLKNTCKRIKKEEEHLMCNICLEQFKENEYKRIVECGHNFHKRCIDKWINKYNNFTCPLCRTDLFAKAHQEIFSQNLLQ